MNPTWENIELLLVKQTAHDDDWSLPKGHIEPDETPERCALRETYEETGMRTRLLYKLPEVKLQYKQTIKTLKMFLAEPIESSDKPCTNHKASEVVDAEYFRFCKMPIINVKQRSIIDNAVTLIQYLYDKERQDPRGKFGLSDAIRHVASYAGDSDDFIEIKLELMKNVREDIRLLFSTRSRETYKQQTNDFEREIAKVWEELTGKKVFFRDDENVSNEGRKNIIENHFVLRTGLRGPTI